MAAFTNAGGRIFATHFSSDLLNSESSISGAANWVSPVTPSSQTGTATINSTSSDSQTMGEWLYGLNGGTEYQVGVSSLRISQTGTNVPTVNWATVYGADWTYESTTITNPVVEFSYYTPVTASSTTNQYGRVFFSDYHVNTGGSSGVFPAECVDSMAKTYAMTAQEEMLEYSLFQLMNFAIPQFAPSVSLAVVATPTTLNAGDTNDNLYFTITNSSSTQDVTLDSTVTLTMTLPTGITASSVSATGWSCTVASSTVTCTLTSVLPAEASNTVDVKVDVASTVTAGTPAVTALLSSKEFTANATLSVTVNTAYGPASTTTALASSAASVMYGTQVTFTATLSSASGTPTGTVTFYAGTTSLGTGQLTGGIATLQTASLAAGTYSMTAVYGGTSNYAASTSPALTQQIIDLSSVLSGSGSGTDSGSSSSSSSDTTTVTATAGGSASVTLSLTSNQSIILPVNSTLTVTGQPSGTGITLTGKNWETLAEASWLFPKGYTLTSPTLTFALPSQLTSHNNAEPFFRSGAAPLLLSLLLLPFARRMRKVGKRLLLLAVLALSLTGTLGVTGCTAHNGFYAEKSYTVTITLTAGSVTKISYVTLNVN
ncbi:Ig-like domain repeat protein (plasmid) [Telmatobacter bradus]|uniref:Ig-like domain repeat protein n=1 Tax=Telmatobacter bradus TaxID=474953 RepID=UPI003B42D128